MAPEKEELFYLLSGSAAVEAEDFQKCRRAKLKTNKHKKSSSFPEFVNLQRNLCIYIGRMGGLWHNLLTPPSMLVVGRRHISLLLSSYKHICNKNGIESVFITLFGLSIILTDTNV